MMDKGIFGAQVTPFFVYLLYLMLYEMDSIKKLIFFFVGFLLVVTVGCNPTTDSLLDKAETLMQEHPKDALALLDSLKQYSLHGKATNARYALLYSMALDKNYIDVKDDSLISIAETWYANKGNIKEKYLSHYYKGVVNSNAKKYPQAITSYSYAQKYEEELGDNYFLGQLYNQLGFIYKRHYNYKKSLESFFKAHELYSLAGKINHKNYMLMNIAGCYWNMGDYTNSEKYYKAAIAEAERLNYKSLLELSVIGIIGQYIEQERYNDAQSINEEYGIKITPRRTKYAGNLARMYYMVGDMQKSEQLLDTAWAFAGSAADSISLYMHEYYIFKNKGNYDLALEFLEKSLDMQNAELQIILQQPVLEVQKDLLEKDYEYNQYKIKANKKIMTLLVVLSVLIVCVAFRYIRTQINKKNERINDYINLLAELQNTLQNMQEKLQLKDSQLSTVYTKAYSTIKTRLNIVNKLSVIFFEKHGTPKEKEAFVKEVENIIDDFRSNKEDIEWMEHIINSSNNHLLENVYKEYPMLKESERKMLCYIYSGLSPKAISIILNIPLQTVYNRKSRLLSKTGLSKQKK